MLGPIIGDLIWMLAELVFSPLYVVVVAVIFWQYHRLGQSTCRFFHVAPEPIWQKGLQSILIGLVGGLLGSGLLTLCGVSVEHIGLSYLWLIAILLFFFHPRFICFSYSAGISSLAHYFFAWPAINIPHLLGLVAILHMVEAFLVMVSGHWQAQPIYLQGADGKLVGGFMMQNFWPLPLVALAIVPTTEHVLQVMPTWWPLLPDTALGYGADVGLLYIFLPVLAALGYGDYVLGTTPRAKSRYSSGGLLVFSLVLLALAILAAYHPQLGIVAALFSPLGHEALIKLGQRRERLQAPCYVEQPGGMMLLAVQKKSSADQAGLHAGDILCGVAGVDYDGHRTVQAALASQGGGQVEVAYRRGAVQGATVLPASGADQHYGMIPVPLADGPFYHHMQLQAKLPKPLAKLAKNILRKLPKGDL